MTTFRRVYAFIYAIFFIALMVYVTGSPEGSSSDSEMTILTAFSIATFLAVFVTQIAVFMTWILGDRTQLWQIYYLVSVAGFCIVTLLMESNPWGHFLMFFLNGLSPLVVAGEMVHNYYNPEPKK